MSLTEKIPNCMLSALISTRDNYSAMMRITRRVAGSRRVDQHLHRARVAQLLERLRCLLDADDRGRQVGDRQRPVGEQADRLLELVDIRERALDAELLEQDRQRIEPRVRAAADDDHRALRRERRKARERPVLAARALQDHIGAEPLDLRPVVAGIERTVDSRRVRVAAALGRRLGQPHARRAEVAREPAAQLADRAAADDEHRAPRELAGLPHRTQRGGRRLHPRRFHTAHAVRHARAGSSARRRVARPGRRRPAGRRHARAWPATQKFRRPARQWSQTPQVSPLGLMATR